MAGDAATSPTIVGGWGKEGTFSPRVDEKLEACHHVDDELEACHRVDNPQKFV